MDAQTAAAPGYPLLLAGIYKVIGTFRRRGC
jgi:hypothetical protein